jgi:hypothetical protein
LIKGIEMLNKQRGQLGEIEESLNEKKRKFKYEIMLSDERNQLEMIERKVDNNQPLSMDSMKIAGIDVHVAPSSISARGQV